MQMQTAGVPEMLRDLYFLMCESAADKEEFTSFLLYCAGRLKKGEPVLKVWLDYQKRAS
ncbi:hypothetical protein SDC9_67791 [bioreactor metagenome]|uniref:Uncharacterized protein n=1 Tax=bioreactor metagenome TaxID=1076179 RepID=A0A644XZL7_9ZZZZ